MRNKAVKLARRDIVEFLLKHKACNIHAFDHENNSAFLVAVKTRQFLTALLLLLQKEKLDLLTCNILGENAQYWLMYWQISKLDPWVQKNQNLPEA